MGLWNLRGFWIRVNFVDFKVSFDFISCLFVLSFMDDDKINMRVFII